MVVLVLRGSSAEEVVVFELAQGAFVGKAKVFGKGLRGSGRVEVDGVVVVRGVVAYGLCQGCGKNKEAPGPGGRLHGRVREGAISRIYVFDTDTFPTSFHYEGFS